MNPLRDQVVTTNQRMIERILAEPPGQVRNDVCVLRVLETVGRTSGRRHRTPVGLLGHGQDRYLVCPDRDRDWPANLRGHPRCLLLAGSERVEYLAAPMAGDEAAHAVAAYLAATAMPWVAAAFPVAEGADLAQVAEALPQMAVFRLSRPAAETSP
ncbi:nitroreductase/quinone reductase family protein [Actinocatenispora comari]|jgi:deazaflavin-dependent oxidoreductase (nitroreductase family)|uniref:Nitroreductase family deazaflavin-dependent oxidoreductase n=1 Tax=Actinocatenispora comari TaxID=2807577 RepID=A0A8J4AK49_9ACTN|nr:nitroreductase/quinone reductase family protein [Actinocatenispora comari]GIL30935.1 hypothetical protein NUM_61890 [Actinocatenispora comari]